MELKYVIMTIIKILISVPTIVMIMTNSLVHAAVLMGGHIDNSADTMHFNNSNSNQAIVRNKTVLSTESEIIPDPEPLVVPGYNLPENIFNKGKPFFLEKDPLTGKVDFNSKSPLVDVEYDDEFEYEDVVQDPSIYEKENIDRKDGSIGSHNTDVNQLTSNFHDFLNLPVKYNPEKYVYPLISSSYANTKVQGNIHQFNHKTYDVTTYKPTVSPTYYFTPKPIVSVPTTTKTTTTTTRPSTLRTSTTPELPNLMGAMNHHSFHFSTPKPTPTTSKFNLVEKTTTRRTLGFFEQLFGEYDDYSANAPTKKAPSLFENLPSNKNKKKDEDNKIVPTEYEYIDENPTDVPLVDTTGIASTTTTSSTTTTKPATDANYFLKEEYNETETTTVAITPRVTSLPLDVKVTSLPLGENHFPPMNLPVITVTNLKEKLNNEKVPPPKPIIPSSNSIRVPANQDTVTFVVGNQQKIVGSTFKASAYDSIPFRPLLVQPNNEDDMVSYSVQATPTFSQSFNVDAKIPEIGMSSATIQPIKNSEASLSIGIPFGDKKIPGRVEDANLDSEIIEFSNKNAGAKIVFPKDIEIKHYNVTPPVHRDVLPLTSQPMYHQLPSDLTPPSDEQDLQPPPPPAPRPPWDPRPGHFFNGRPEYSRPPRPATTGEIYKRIDKLPNILPQFRPNVKTTGPLYHEHVKNGYIRQPLLDRPSNRPVGFF